MDILENIKLMMHENIDFILGKNETYILDFDDVNLKYIDADCFLNTCQSNKEEIFNVLKDCVRDSQYFLGLFISHMIVMNYSFFILKKRANEMLLLKFFLNDNEVDFIRILSLAIDIGFYVWEDSFEGLNLEKYLERVEKSDFLIDDFVDK
ncbi:hypothetical protein ID858_02210 [Xenorhabdus sp. DI]|nr:hypothetical protein [Xenorhabdus sp. 3]MBD2787326.1 hypothetical protein [Xenorhabdus sp. DI]